MTVYSRQYTVNSHNLQGVLLATLALWLCICANASSNSNTPFPRIDRAEKYWPLVEDYCIECHNFDDWKGKLEFESLFLDNVPQDAEIWEQVIRKLRGGLMPPPGEQQPPGKTAGQFVTWLEDYIDYDFYQPGKDSELEPIRTRRLNRKEYRNAVRDLLGVDVNVEDLLPQDIAVDGFDNMASALSVSPVYLDQSLYAARFIATQALGNSQARPVTSQYRIDSADNQQQHVDGLPLGTRGGMQVRHYFPVDGEYRLSIGDLARAMWVRNQEFTHTLIALIDGKQFFELDIGGGDDLRAIDKHGGAAADAINARLKDIPFFSEAGFHDITVTFLHRSFAEAESALQPLQTGGQPNVIRLGGFDIHGPIKKQTLSSTETRQRVFHCYPQSSAEQRECAEAIIQRFVHRAYRGMDTASDRQQLLKVYEQGRTDAGFDNGICRALTAILANPKFLYHWEPQIDGETEIANIHDKVLANRLALFIWGSIPDAELLRLADQGKLKSNAVLEQQVRRMLADPKADNLVDNFAYQWLNLDGLDEIDPDPRIFAEVPGDIRALFKQETKLFVRGVFREDRDLRELLTASHSYLNESLALHYGIRDVRGDRFRRVELQNANRWGLLGKGGVLMVSSYPNRTSPVLRGAYVMEHLIGTPPTAPPPDVEALPESVAGGKQLTVRERLEMHREKPSCNGCHGVIDPLGFALENFDAVGRWREIDRFARIDIDASGQLPNGMHLEGVKELRQALLSRPDQFVQAFTEKLLTYAISRPVEYEDMPAVREIVDAAEQDDYRFSSIVMGIVNSPQFLNVRREM